jgi:hypothetical protein
MTRDRSGSEVKIQSSVENLGYLHQLKKGRWKRRWFLLRHGILYKYSTPKVRFTSVFVLFSVQQKKTKVSLIF